MQYALQTFFGFNKEDTLYYRGRFDQNKALENSESSRDLFYAMINIAKKNVGPIKQIPSMGCAIKWK